MTLAVLVKFMLKHGLQMSENVQKEIHARYRAPKAIAKTILKVRNFAAQFPFI